jgi:hypothetical protein
MERFVADDILYQTLLVSYKKNKATYDKEVWCLSSSNNVGEIMNDAHSMQIIGDQCYPSTYKGERKILVKKVLTTKILWKKIETSK